ncbi:PQQ-binding-like beta-propeller repeat protein, partial [Cellulomonas shaoxiangyii]
PSPAPARRRRRRFAVAGAALAVVLLGAQLVTDARDRAALAELRTVPGVRAPLPDALTEVWRLPLDRLPRPVVPTGDPLTGVRGTPDGSELVALAPATGADAWVVPLTSAPADAVDTLGTPQPTCHAGAATTGRPALLVCLVTDAWSRDAGVLAHDVPPTTSRLVVVRATDGTVVAEHATDAGPGTPATSLALLGEVAVLGHPVEPDTLLVRGVDVTTGEERWRREPPTGRPLLGLDARGVRRVDGAAAVRDVDGVELLDAEGTLVRRARVPADATVAWTDGADGRGRLLVTDGEQWHLVTQRLNVLLPRPPVDVPVDDGSGGRLVLAATRAGLHAVDTATGRQRWTVSVDEVHSALVVQGRVHAVAADGVHTYDARTGAPLWEHLHAVHDEAAAGTVGTDGRDLYVPVADEGEEQAVRLLRLALPDGRPSTPVAVPPGLSGLSTGPGPVLGRNAAGEVVGLG